MFSTCYVIDNLPDMDVAKGTDFSSMFANCYCLTKAPKLKSTLGTNFYNIFQNCHLLEEVPLLDLFSATNTSNLFYYCAKLRVVNLKNIKISGIVLGTGTSWGQYLTVDSLINTLKELWDYSSGSSHSITIGTYNKPKLDNVYVKLITPTAEQIAEDPNINSKMPCEVCASTDEGAMLILDYASAKGWTIS